MFNLRRQIKSCMCVSVPDIGCPSFFLLFGSKVKCVSIVVNENYFL